ncbi:hypothetical protein POVWA2_020920 [Plasmodium ovale wallikeri]|uniref:Uncharacterized protein n=1 Tax=Plasmodium ovale wallikeri TaxID=864142 RepID=A0A1A8YR97_PLAOA|nr:hypothetical protein POVWA1_020710 [Plasmodium ovale wallikeri]SBT34636.1 hypothetical protein POVWA2_020920 [Plasmodium ovale wallikeri]
MPLLLKRSIRPYHVTNLKLKLNLSKTKAKANAKEEKKRKEKRREDRKEDARITVKSYFAVECTWVLVALPCWGIPLLGHFPVGALPYWGTALLRVFITVNNSLLF